MGSTLTSPAFQGHSLPNADIETGIYLSRLLAKPCGLEPRLIRVAAGTTGTRRLPFDQFLEHDRHALPPRKRV
jgi:hypothetical protein